MKQVKYIAVLVFVFVFALPSCTTQKNSAAIAALKSAIENRDFTFHAQQVLPRDYRISQIFPTANAQMFNLSPGYVVKVMNDSLVVDLPFFGRAFQAPMDPTKGSIKLTTTNFTIKQSKGRKGNIDVTIYPQNSNEIQQMYLTISESGYATLSVISYQREQIGFYGIAQ